MCNRLHKISLHLFCFFVFFFVLLLFPSVGARKKNQTCCGYGFLFHVGSGFFFLCGLPPHLVLFPLRLPHHPVFFEVSAPCSLTKKKNGAGMSVWTAMDREYASTVECGLSVTSLVLPASDTHHHTVNLQTIRLHVSSDAIFFFLAPTDGKSPPPFPIIETR